MPSNRNLYLAATVACLTGALFGYSVGFIGGILVLPSFLNHFHLHDLAAPALASATSGTVAAWLVGTLVGVPIGMHVCSRWGRRSGLAVSAALYLIGASVQLGEVGGKLGVFDVGRWINGVGVGAGTLLSPIYIAEISTPSRRGMLLSGYQTAIQMAALAGFWSAYASHNVFLDTSDWQWRIPVAVQLVPALLLLTCIFAVPESPKFLVDQGITEKARTAIGWLRRLPAEHTDVEDELGELLESTNTLRAVQDYDSNFWQSLQKRSVRKRLGIGIGLMVAQNMVGLNALNYYAPTIFMSAGFTSVSSSLALTGLFGVVKLISAMAFMFVFVRIRGNRFWLLFGSALCGISMLILALSIRSIPTPGSSGSSLSSAVNATTIKLTFTGLLSVAMVYIFAFGFGISLGPLSWNVCSEIFPASIRTACCAVTTGVQWLFQLVIAGITPWLLQHFGWATYAFYAACCLVSFIWIAICVPETKGVKLGRDMDSLFMDKVNYSDASCAVEAGEETALLQRAERRVGRRDSIGFSV